MTGHRWLALIGVTAAVALMGLGALAILEESPRPLARRHAVIIAITGTAACAAGGLALLVLGPLAALDTPGSAVMRIIGGGFFTVFGGMAMGMAVGVRHVYRTDWGLPRTWQDGGVGSLMLLDTASLYYRAFFGVPDTVRAPDGTPVNAIRGLLDTIGRLVRARHPARLVACLDADWRPAFRVAAIPSYKAHRLNAEGTEETPPALAVQVPVIEEVLRASGLASAGQPGFEADDVMATLSARSADPVDVVTGDRDLFQLVDDARGVRIIYTVRGLLNMDVIDEAAVAAKYGIPGRAYADYAALRGDPSDGLPGVPGVGEKTAAALINTFGSIDGIIVALEAGHGGFPRGSRDKLEKARDYLDVALSVVRVVEDVPLPEIGGELPVVAADPDRLKELGERWGLGSSLTRFVTAVSQP